MAKGIVDLNGIQCYVQVLSYYSNEWGAFSYKNRVYDRSDDAVFQFAGDHGHDIDLGYVRTFILSAPLSQNLNPDLYSVRVEIENPLSQSDNITNLHFKRGNYVTSHEVYKREDSFVVMITQKRVRNSNFKSHPTIIGENLGGVQVASRVAQAGGIRIKFAVYADLE